MALFSVELQHPLEEEWNRFNDLLVCFDATGGGFLPAGIFSHGSSTVASLIVGASFFFAFDASHLAPDLILGRNTVNRFV